MWATKAESKSMIRALPEPSTRMFGWPSVNRAVKEM